MQRLPTIPLRALRGEVTAAPKKKVAPVVILKRPAAKPAQPVKPVSKAAPVPVKKAVPVPVKKAPVPAKPAPKLPQHKKPVAPAVKVAPKPTPKPARKPDKSKAEQLADMEAKQQRAMRGVVKHGTTKVENVMSADEIRNKLMNENEAKAIEAARKAIMDRLRRANGFVKQFGSGMNMLQTIISTEYEELDLRLGSIKTHRDVKTRKTKVRLNVQTQEEIDDESAADASQFDSSSVNDFEADPPVAPPSFVGAGYSVTAAKVASETNELKLLNMRASSQTFFSDDPNLPEFRNFFGGKERSLVMISRIGTLHEEVDMNLNHDRFGFSVPYTFEDTAKYNSLVSRVAETLDMKRIPGLGYKKVLDTLTIRQLRGGREFGFFNGTTSGTRFDVVGAVESDNAYGMWIAYEPSHYNNDLGKEMEPGMMVGFWVAVGVTDNEMKTLSEGRFDEHFDNPRRPAEITKFVGKSLLTQFFNSTNRSLSLSIADLSLLNAVEPGEDFIGKSGNGAILYVPFTDIRNQFESWNSDRVLPEELPYHDFVPGTHMTYRDMFAGRIVYTDMKNKLMFFYSQQGNLIKAPFDNASELNVRDRANLMKRKSENPDEVKSNRKQISFYGTAFTFYQDKFALAYGITTASDRFREMAALGKDNLNGFREAPGGEIISEGVYLTIEGLRESYNGDKLLYNLLNDYYRELSLNAAYYFSVGHRDVVAFSGNEGNVVGKYKFGGAEYSYAPTIGLMLNIARKPQTEWPSETELIAQADEVQRKMTKPNAEEVAKIANLYDGLVKQANGEFPELMPHQVETLAIAANSNSAAFDVDMGGGKTIMAVLDMVRLMRDGITLPDGSKAACRPLVVMPGKKLIENYVDDVRKFFGNNLNIFVLETSSAVKNALSDSDIVEQMQNAPANTIFVASYSWLTAGKKYKVTLQNQPQADGSIRPIERVFYSRAEMLKRVPITAVYLDESHKIKTRKSSQNAVCMALSGVPVKRLLTGTMIQKDVTDLFEQSRFLDSTLIGSQARFDAQHMLSSDEAKAMGLGARAQLRPGAEKEARKELRENGVLQLRRSAWLHLLPPKKEKFVFVEMSDLMRTCYQNMLAAIIGSLDEAVEKGIITVAQRNEWLKLTSLLDGGLAKTKSEDGDDGDDEDEEVASRAVSAFGESGAASDDGDDNLPPDARKRRDQAENADKVKKNMGIMIAAMQDFLTAPELLNPATFNNSPMLIQSLRDAGLLDEHGKVVGLSDGPKDSEIIHIARQHFAPIGGHYAPLSKQLEDNDGDYTKCRGKILIFHENTNAIIHTFNVLRKDKSLRVGMYLTKGEKGYANSSQDLADFKDPENDRIQILCAAEKSLLLGQNMQSADTVIRLSTPWTTGDYDQSIARAFRCGQKLAVTAWNIQVNSSFEVLKLIKLFVREASNKQLSSDFEVGFKIPPKFGDCSLENHLEFANESTLRSFPVLRYFNPKRPGDGFEEDTADLFTELHDEIWKQENTAAFGKDPSRINDPEYLMDPFNHCEAARYYKLGIRGMTPMASGKSVIAPASLDVTPKDASGKPVGHGVLATTGYTALFNAAVEDKPNIKTLRVQEIRKLAASNDPGERLRAIIEECMDAMFEAKPAYLEAFDEDRRDIQDAIYADLVNTRAKRAKDFNFSKYVKTLDNAFYFGVYNMVISKYSIRGLAKITPGKAVDPTINAHIAVLNARLLGGQIQSFRKAHKLETPQLHEHEQDPELGEDVEVLDLAEDAPDDVPKVEDLGDDEVPVTDDEIPLPIADDEDEFEEVPPEEYADVFEEEQEPEEEEPEPGLPQLVLGISRYYSDASPSGKRDDARVMLFSPVSAANPIAKKLDGLPLPSGKKFAKRLQCVYVKSPVTNTVHVQRVLKAIESNGGNIEDKEAGPRGGTIYHLPENNVLLKLLNAKAPSVKVADSEHSIGNLIRDRAHHAEVTAAPGKAQNIDIGFLVLDGKVTLIAFPDRDKKDFNAAEQQILAASGFRRIVYYVVTYAQAEVAKLEKDLTSLATKFLGTGVEFYNEVAFERYLKYALGFDVDFASLRKPVSKKRARRD